MVSYTWTIRLAMLVGDGIAFPFSSNIRLYIIEGSITIVFAFSTFWLLPNKPENAYFLNAHDQENMMIRAEQTRVYIGQEAFEWRQVRNAFKDFKLYLRYVFSRVIFMVVLFVSSARTCVFMDSVLFYPSLLKQWDTVLLRHNT